MASVRKIQEELSAGKKIEDCRLRVTFYARVSTGKDEQLNSLDSQVKRYEDRIQKNENWEFVEGYVDKGKSGKSVKGREEFLRMIEDAKAGRFDLILTKEISRFSRDTLDSLKYTRDLLGAGVGVYFDTEGFSTFEKDREFELTLRSTIAQSELKRISERVRNGFDTAIRIKHSVLGSNCIWGYRKKRIIDPLTGTSRAALEIDEEQAEVVRRIFRMYVDEKYGIRKICAILNAEGVRNTHGDPLSFSSVRGILRNMKYKGHYCGGKTARLQPHEISERETEKKRAAQRARAIARGEKVEEEEKREEDAVKYRGDMREIPQEQWFTFKDETGEVVPAIIDEETWDRANALLDMRSEKMSAEDKTSYQNKYTYSGKIICGEHGTRYHRACYHYKSGDKEVWQCKLYTTLGKSACDNLVLYTTEIEQIVRSAYAVVMKNQEQMVDELVELYRQAEDDSEEQARREKELVSKVEQIKRRKSSLLDNLVDGTISKSDYKAKSEELDRELGEREKQLFEFQNRQAESRKHQQNVELLRELIAKEMDFEDGLPPEVVDSLLDRIEVYKTDKPRSARLKVFFRVLPEQCMEYDLIREKHGVTSVCSVAST